MKTQVQPDINNDMHSVRLQAAKSHRNGKPRRCDLSLTETKLVHDAVLKRMGLQLEGVQVVKSRWWSRSMTFCTDSKEMPQLMAISADVTREKRKVLFKGESRGRVVVVG